MKMIEVRDMSLAFKIAWRNLWRHRGRSLTVGVILFIGAFLMTVGNGIISGMEKGLSSNITRLFTGDLVVISNRQENRDVFFGTGGKPLKVIKNYPGVKKVLEAQPKIRDFLPITAGTVWVFNSGSQLGSSMLLGVDLGRYQKFFPGSFRVTEGRVLRPGERGVLLSELARKQAYESMHFWLLPVGVQLNLAKLPSRARVRRANLEIRQELVFMGACESQATMDVRVPLKGLIQYKSLNQYWGNYGLIDLESFREAHNYVTGNNAAVSLSQDEQKLLSSDALDQILAKESLMDEQVVSRNVITAAELKAKVAQVKTKSRTDLGSYNLILLKTQPRTSLNEVIHRLNAAFGKNRIPARVISWKEAVGRIGSMALLIKGALNLFIMFIFWVAIIVIMNTLSMAALERTTEIAMMRAVGAQRGFVAQMFIWETGLLAGFFGGLGIGTGLLCMLGLGCAHLTATNELFQIIYGGDRLQPVFTGADLLLGLGELALVTVLAVLYPLRVVAKIAPLDAMARE